MGCDGEALQFIRDVGDIWREAQHRNPVSKSKRPKAKRVTKKHRRSRLPKG